ncbi:MAG TPA: endonuclease/exonuclease/phosphatase family protein [Hanamia sp.]|jgi:endonuclease/exonuclease/phosphatase family metal-dependent hydrolase|nr:endonuclease/exonuclease/phosphatase family protein [Hanamia sp.]
MSYYRTPVYKKILIFINICFVIAYLFVCLVPFVNTSVNWFIAVPGIIFPLLLFVLLAFIILWAILKSKFIWVSVITVFIGFQQIAAVFSFHLPSDFSAQKQPNTLRVMQWNVMGFDQTNEQYNIENGGHSLRPFIMDVINEQNADVLCFEEFFESNDTAVSKSNITTITKMGFPYHYFVPVENEHSEDRSGIIIFSKNPIIDTAKFDLNTNKKGEHLIYADIKVNNKVCRIFATHLIPIKFGQWDEQRSVREQLYGQEGLDTYKNIFAKLLRGYEFRYYQALLVGRKIAESPYPAIICGDFNDIPNSSTYFNVKGELQDPFLKKGFWTGRTTRKSFGIISPTLRIDYILASRIFKVNQFQILHVPYSDHYPVETDLQW